MDFQDFPASETINEDVREYRETPGAVLIDVRLPEEYEEGHIPGSKNIPLSSIREVSSLADDFELPLFVYCHSGARSSRAVYALKAMGYTNVKNLGGISAYTGKLES